MKIQFMAICAAVSLAGCADVEMGNEATND